MTKKGFVQNLGLAVDGDLLFFHAFQQAGLGARRRAVDFVSQQDVGKKPARNGRQKSPGFLVVEMDAG